MANPKCRNCGKRLQKIWWEMKWAEKNIGREPLETREASYSSERHQFIEGFYGTYGKGGCNNFCSHKCGFNYANRMIARIG